GIFNVEFAHKAYPNLNIEIDLKGGGDPNSIHINLDVPFIKLSKLANSSLYSNFDISKPLDGILTDRNLRDCAPLKYAYGIVKTCKEFQSFIPKLKQMMMLFFYQNTVYIQEDIQKETVEFPVEDTFKDYVENMQGRAAVGKLKFDVLFKVGKADIMHTILTPADNRQLVNDTVRTKIADILKKIAVLSSAKSNNPNGFPAEKYCECLYANALNDGYYYDEPRISGLIRPREIGKKKENGYYVVAELRTTALNNAAKNVYSQSYTEDMFKTRLSGFIKELCGFVKELTD
ncbi:MAG: hypothetical protein K2O67_01575, partial [Clostridia bacterium]|nr:hypothetical protein [Clostridia bacterium]